MENMLGLLKANLFYPSSNRGLYFLLSKRTRLTAQKVLNLESPKKILLSAQNLQVPFL
jgi:hypothetical protein